MAIYRSSYEDIKSYYESSRLNQSTLKDLEFGLENFKEKQKGQEENKTTPSHFLFGGAADLLLTGTEEDFNKTYYVLSSDSIPSDTIKTVLEELYDMVKGRNIVNPDLEMHRNELSTLPTLLNWYANRKIETKVAGVIKDGSDYFKALVESEGKEVLSSELKAEVDNYVEVIKNHPRTAPYFNMEVISEDVNVDYYFQFIIYFDVVINGTRIPCKAMLDLLKAYKNDNGEVIALEPIDLKSTSKNLIDFPREIKRWRYDIQGAFYTDALLDPTAIFIGNENNLKLGEHTELYPFKFIVESSINPKNPAIFIMDESLLDIGRDGIVTLTDEENPIARRERKGYFDLLNDYEFYVREGWEIDKTIAEGDPNGIIVDWKGIM